LKKACPIVKGYVFSNKWELSDFYSKFPLFVGFFSFLREFEESLPYCQKLRVQLINENFPIFIGIFRFLWEFEENLHSCQKLIVQQ
jgi:hypothetical protein